MRWRVLLFALILFSMACTWGTWVKDFGRPKSAYDVVRLDRLTVGGSKSDVLDTLGEPDRVVGTKQFTDALVEVWEYEQWDAQSGPDRVVRRHWIYFIDDKVFQWGDPGDWESEAVRLNAVRENQ